MISFEGIKGFSYAFLIGASSCPRVAIFRALNALIVSVSRGKRTRGSFVLSPLQKTRKNTYLERQTVLYGEELHNNFCRTLPKGRESFLYEKGNHWITVCTRDLRVVNATYPKETKKKILVYKENKANILRVYIC